MAGYDCAECSATNSNCERMMQTKTSSLNAGGVCVLTPSGSTVRRGERLSAWINAYEGAWDASRDRVSQVWIPTGPQPGHATIEIRKTQWSRKANRVAFRDPWKEIRIGQRVTIARKNSRGILKHFWCGSVVSPTADIGKDSLVISCLDDRWLMQDIRIVGRHVVIPATGVLQWQQGWPAEFNPGGRPNMILSATKSVDGVSVPGFSPYPDYGLAPDEAPPATSTSKACYWTLSWIFRYLHYACGPWSTTDDQGVAIADTRYTGSFAPKVCPSSIQWTPGMASWLDAEETAWFDNGRSQGKAQASGTNRKGRSLSADGYGLLDFMEVMLATAGGYTLGWIMNASVDSNGTNTSKSILSIVRAVARGGDANGSTIYVVRGGSISNLEVKSKYWTGGNYTEDGKDVVTRSMGLGNLVKIERQVDTYVTVALQKRWDETELTALRARGDALNVESVEGMRSLFSEFPNVFAAWKLNPSFDFQADTSESAMPRAAVPRPVLPYLLSWIGNQAYDYVAQRYPIRWEVSTNDGSSWTAITEMTGLEVLDDGTIFMPSLREMTLAGLPGSWSWNGSGYQWGAGAIKVHNLRATIAIPCDHRMAAVCKLVQSQLASFDDSQTTPDQTRIDRLLDRQDVIDLRGLYDLWLRVNSYPVPKSQLATKAVDKPTRDNPLKNDTEFLRSHMRRHMFYAGRLKRFGYVSKRGTFDTSILELGREYSYLNSIVAGNTTEILSIAAVRSAVEYLSGPGYTETRMHLE